MDCKPLLLTLKLILVPAIILLVSLAGRRWGARVAGRLSSFPVVAGPILIFLTAEQGPGFAADAAAAAVAAVGALSVFALSYAWLATRHDWPLALAGAYAAFGVCALLATQLAGPVWLHALISAGILLLVARLMPHHLPATGVLRAMRFELPIRMVCGASLVLFITWLAELLGPRGSGVLAAFPVLASVLAVFSHRNAGAAYVAVLLRGIVWGCFAMLSFCLMVALLLPSFSPWLAFPLALAAALGANVLVSRVLRGR
jgi:uncharacterized membrane protein (GlpM family)